MENPSTPGVPPELIRRIRHDANNALTSALGHVQLAFDDPALQNERVQGTLRRIETELRRLTEIIRRLNDLPDGTVKGPP
jgi:signal transduction histidine kinase